MGIDKRSPGSWNATPVCSSQWGYFPIAHNPPGADLSVQIRPPNGTILREPFMEPLGYINTEGGPVLVVDGASASAWNGIDGSDYKNVCALFDGNPALEGGEIAVGGNKGIVWEMCGAGTADVFRSTASHIVIIRSWLHDPLDRHASMTLAEQPLSQPTRIGSLSADSMTIAILWAPERGQGFHLPPGLNVARPIGELSIDSAGLVVRAPGKRLHCFHDQVENSAGSARRLHILTNFETE
jgi:hypothetical protein